MSKLHYKNNEVINYQSIENLLSNDIYIKYLSKNKNICFWV